MTRMRARSILAAALVTSACAASRPPAGPSDPGADARSLGCDLEMPPARDIETYAGVAPVWDLAAAPVGDPLLAHSLDREPIRAVVREHQADLRACYDRGLLRDPDLTGRVDVRWTIVPGGAVEDVELAETTLADACVVRCVLGEVATWTFPGFRGLQREIRLVYPFLFRRG